MCTVDVGQSLYVLQNVTFDIDSSTDMDSKVWTVNAKVKD